VYEPAVRVPPHACATPDRSDDGLHMKLIGSFAGRSRGDAKPLPPACRIVSHVPMTVSTVRLAGPAGRSAETSSVRASTSGMLMQADKPVRSRSLRVAAQQARQPDAFRRAVWQGSDRRAGYAHHVGRDPWGPTARTAAFRNRLHGTDDGKERWSVYEPAVRVAPHPLATLDRSDDGWHTRRGRLARQRLARRREAASPGVLDRSSRTADGVDARLAGPAGRSAETSSAPTATSGMLMQAAQLVRGAALTESGGPTSAST
jgi:hypothetical protein